MINTSVDVRRKGGKKYRENKKMGGYVWNEW